MNPSINSVWLRSDVVICSDQLPRHSPRQRWGNIDVPKNKKVVWILLRTVGVGWPWSGVIFFLLQLEWLQNGPLRCTNEFPIPNSGYKFHKSRLQINYVSLHGVQNDGFHGEVQKIKTSCDASFIKREIRKKEFSKPSPVFFLSGVQIKIVN